MTLATPQESLVPALGAAAKLSFEQIATIPRPGSQGLSMVHFSPDDRYITYLGSANSADLSRQLYAYDRQTGATRQVIAGGITDEASLSKEEALRRERARIMSTGVTEYSWAKKANRILVPKDGALYVQDGVGAGSEATLRRLFDPSDAQHAAVGKGPLLDAKLSEDGSVAFWVWEDEVCCCEVADEADGSIPRRLTTGARGSALTNGVADFCAQEEMNRYTGYWPSPGAGGLVAFEEVDESHIPQFTIMNQGVDGPHASNEEHRYPFAGMANPKVRLGVTASADSSSAASAVTWFDLSGPFGEDFYLARVQWVPGPGSAEGAPPELLAQVESRDQLSLALLRLDPATGTVSTLLIEKSDVWINLHDMLAPLDDGRAFLWASERSGWRHLYVHDARTGECLRELTSGEWHVEELIDGDGPAGDGYVYFMGCPAAGAAGEALAAGSYTEKHLFRVRIDGSDAVPEQVTLTPGVHSSAALSHDRACFVDQLSSAEEPALATLTALPPPTGDTAVDPASLVVEKVLHSARATDARVEALSSVLVPPRFVSFPSTDGKVTLHGALYVPDRAVHGPGPYPTVVSCYGGPNVQFVQNAWAFMTADLRAQFLRSQGFLVAKVDNRGSARRGLAFEGAVRGALGSLEVDDQVALVEVAADLGLADRARVGIMGWSYGGYLSAMCLAKAPKVFRCALVGAPVTSWDGYDTHYTERYMGGTPDSMADAYAESSVMAHVDGIEGAIMLVHGMMDENVHFRHSARLTQAMVESQKSYELLSFPKERHSPRSLKDRTYMERQVYGFLHRWLKG